MTLTSSGAALNPDMFAKVLRDLVRLSPNARRLDVEAAVWRSIKRHTNGLTAEEIADLTWRVLRNLAGVKGNAA